MAFKCHPDKKKKNICLQNYPIKIIDYPMRQTKNPIKSLITKFKEKMVGIYPISKKIT